MTGFAFTEGEKDGWAYSVDLKGYNNRYLEILVSLPTPLLHKEFEVREFLQERVSRGRVELTVRLRESGGALPLEVNEEAVRQVVGMIARVRDIAEIGGPIQIQHLLAFPEIFRVKKETGAELLWEIVRGPFEKVFGEFESSRKREGQRTRNDILHHLHLIRSGKDQIASRADELEEHLRINLRKRFLDLLPEVDENRVHTETAVLLMRYGINEELARLGSHLDSFEEYGIAEAPMGKKLDFLAQEISREVNTIGSKTMMADVQKTVVTMKDALENIREQLRNVE